MTDKFNSTRVRVPTSPGAVSRTTLKGITKVQLDTTTSEVMTSTALISSGDGRASMMACLSASKLRTSNARNQDLRSWLSVATWNVLTLNHTGKMTALVQTLHEHHIALTDVTEARLLGSDCSKVEGYTILHSGSLHHVNGVALVISASLAAGLMNWSPSATDYCEHVLLTGMATSQLSLRMLLRMRRKMR